MRCKALVLNLYSEQRKKGENLEGEIVADNAQLGILRRGVHREGDKSCVADEFDNATKRYNNYLQRAEAEMKEHQRKITIRKILAIAPFALAVNVAFAQSSGEADAIDEIIVEGQRISLINALQEKKNSDAVADILSADSAGRFPDPNIAESLARLPGISFQRNNDSGEGEFISIRGLDAAFNTVTFDGVRTGTADSERRTALDIITSNNISAIKVSKAPLPEDASEGIGGVIDIRTRGPLERRDDIRFSADARDSSFNDNVGRRFAASINHTFSDNFAVNVSAAYRRTFINTIADNPTGGLSTLTPTVLTGQNGTTVTIVDDDELSLVPRDFLPIDNFTLEQIDFQNTEIDRENISISALADWAVSDSTILTFGGRFTRDDRASIETTLEFDVDDDDIVNGLRVFDGSEVTFEGEIEDIEEEQERYFIRGETALDNWTFNYVASYSRAFESDPVLSIDFTNAVEDVPGGTDTTSFQPLLLNGTFTSPNPSPAELAVFQAAIDPLCVDAGGSACGEINDFDEELVASEENDRFAAKFDATYEFSNDGPLQNIKFGVLYERSNIETIELDISATDDSLGPNGEFLGIDDPNEFGGSLGDNNAVPGDLGLIDGSLSSFSDIGNQFSDIGLNGIPRFNGNRLREIRSTFRSGFLASGSVPESLEVLNSTEEFFTTYGQAKLTFGKLDIIGGARIEYYDADFAAPNQFAATVEFDDAVNGGDDELNLAPRAGQGNQVMSATNNWEVLPRIAFNFNVSDELIVRASYTTSLARPVFDDLATGVDGDITIELNDGVVLANATLADISDVSLDFQTGNVDLDNAYSQNFDLSVEWYADNQNSLSLALFYKQIDDFIFNRGEILFDGATQGAGGAATVVANPALTDQGLAIVNQLGGLDAITALTTTGVSQPDNGGTAHVRGVELGFFHSADYLPGILSNLIVVGNVTYQENEIDLFLGVLGDDDALVQIGDAQSGDRLVQEFPFFNSPDLIYNVALLYSGEDVEATLAWRHSGLQFESVRPLGVSQFQQERGFLDFDFEYAVRDIAGIDKATLFFSANDLLDDGEEFTTFETYGETERINDFATFNGRQFAAGFRLRF